MEIVESLLVDKVRSYYGEHASAMSDSHAIHRNARTANVRAWSETNGTIAWIADVDGDVL